MNDYGMGYLFSAILGLAMGSFANVVIFRVPNHESVITPRSKCPSCKKYLAWYDNIPLLSFILLGGKCRFCKQSISPRYPLVELLTALLFVAVYWKFGPTLETIWYMSLVFILVITAFVDLDHMIIPQSFINAGLFVGGLGLLAFWDSRWISSLIGAALISGFLFLAGLMGKGMFHKESMGSGDVLLGLVIGMFLGWKLSIVMLFLSFLSAAVILLLLMAVKKVKTGMQIPFGPFLALGTLLALFLGDFFIHVYMTYIWV